MSARRQPRDATPKGGTQLLAVCVTPGQLDHFAALVLQQRAKQSALRKGHGGCRNVISSAFHKRLSPPFTSDCGLIDEKVRSRFSCQYVDNRLDGRVAPQK